MAVYSTDKARDVQAPKKKDANCNVHAANAHARAATG